MKPKVKQCSKCNKIRLLRFFNINPRYRFGVTGWCKDCIRGYHNSPEPRKRRIKRWAEYISIPENRERQRVRKMAAYRRNPRQYKDRRYRNKYGISLAYFERTKRCILCARKVHLVADHDHVTQEFRGALCVTCNLMIAWVERTPSALKKIKNYLRRG